MTDANVFLGRLNKRHFPAIFGPRSDLPLDEEASRKAIEDLTQQVNVFFAAQKRTTRMTSEELAYGFLSVANESMCKPIRAMTVSRGFDVKTHVLVCFGGAGPQHACALARALRMRQVFVHRLCSVLSAYGLNAADIVHEEQVGACCCLACRPLLFADANLHLTSAGACKRGLECRSAAWHRSKTRRPSRACFGGAASTERVI